MNWRTGLIRVLLVLTVGAMFLVFALGVSAQVQTTQTTTTGHPTQQVSVEHAEVVHVSGNDLVVKMQDGTIRHFANVPESTKVLVDGKELGIHDLQPGMKLERTITTTTIPKTVTTTQTVTGKIWSIQPPNSAILTLDNGKNERFTIPKGQTFNVNGREVDAWHLRKGMTVTATKVTEEPETLIEKQHQLTGRMPPPPPAPPADQPILVAVIVPVATPAAEQEPAQEAAPQQLPKTGSELPLLALLGCLSLAGSAGSRLLRRFDH